MSINTPNNSSTSTGNALVDGLQAMSPRSKKLTFASLGMLLLYVLIALFDTHNEAIAGPAPFMQRALPIFLLLGSFLCSGFVLVQPLFGEPTGHQKNYVQIGINVLALLFVFLMLSSGIFALIAIAGCLGAIIGLIWLIVRGFQVSALWGLISLFVPFGFIVFTVVHWPAAKRPFLLTCAGFGVVLVLLPVVMMSR